MNTPIKTRQSKKQALAHINIRIPKEVVDFYRQYPSYTKKMREVLTAHAISERQGVTPTT
jgi:hypothetical protein